jgi:hypothetical protein
MRTLLAEHTRDVNPLDLAHQAAVRSDILAAPSSLTCRLDKTFAEFAANVVPSVLVIGTPFRWIRL